MAQTEEFIFQNVAYRATVYKTGSEFILCNLFPFRVQFNSYLDTIKIVVKSQKIYSNGTVGNLALQR